MKRFFMGLLFICALGILDLSAMIHDVDPSQSQADSDEGTQEGQALATIQEKDDSEGESDVEDGEGDEEEARDDEDKEDGEVSDSDDDINVILDKKDTDFGKELKVFETNSIWHNLVLFDRLEKFNALLADGHKILDVNALMSDIDGSFDMQLSLLHGVVYSYALRGKAIGGEEARYCKDLAGDEKRLAAWFLKLLELGIDPNSKGDNVGTAGELAVHMAQIFRKSNQSRRLCAEEENFAKILENISNLINEQTEVVAMAATITRELDSENKASREVSSSTKLQSKRSWWCCSWLRCKRK